MKKYIYLLLALLFAGHITIYGQASAYQFVSQNPVAPPEGGTLAFSLAYSSPGDPGRVLLVPGDVELIEYETDSRVVTSVTNTGGTFFIELAMTNVDYHWGGKISLYVRIAEHNEKLRLTLPYQQDGFDEFFGGVITFSGSGIYRPGTQPPMITSYRPALGGTLPIDGSGTVYCWEKKNAGDPDWTTMQGQTDLTCMPDIMGEETVYYRRKATKGNQIAYSTQIEILSRLSAGLISLSVSEDKQYLHVDNMQNPSVDWKYTSLESSSDLNVWQTIATASSSARLALPQRTTYYRRTAKPTTGDAAYSNIVSYNTDGGVYISTKTATDSLGNGYNEDITYYDGLGRPQQTVNVNGSPSGQNLVTFFSYDTKGRRPNDYLPFTTAPGDILLSAGTGALIRQQGRYYAALYGNNGTVYPYVHREYDGTPLDRPAKTFRQGKEYQAQMDHFSENRYGVNTANEVLRLTVGADGALVCEASPHNANTLYKTTTVDEDGACEEIFTNADGLKVLSRQWLSATEHADTYYAYDAMDRLRWVVSPEGSALLVAGTWEPTGDNARKYCYRYLYDGDGNVASRHIPGQAPEIMTYDANGRMLTRQTGAMEQQKVLLSYTYDPLGRLSRVTLQQTGPDTGKPDPDFPSIIDPVDPYPDKPVTPDPVPIDPVLPVDPEGPDGPLRPVTPDPFLPSTFGAPFGPAGLNPGTTGKLPTKPQSHDTERYFYDTYMLDSEAYAGHAFAPVAGVADQAARSKDVRGLKTHEEIFRTFDSSVLSGTSEKPLSARRTFYYDRRNRVIQSVETTPFGYLVRTSYKYDYSGNVLVRDERHILPEAGPTDIRYTYTYDNRGRQTRETVAIDGTVLSDVASAYDDLGRLTMRNPADNNLTAQYTYNIQGWLSGIEHSHRTPSVNLHTEDTTWLNTPIFSERLHYFNPQVAKPLYSGNIAEISWNRDMDLLMTNTYVYSYDKLNRLTDAELYKPSRSGDIMGRMTRDNTYTERNMNYDLNGNMRSFERYNGDELNKYIYGFDGNRITGVKRCPGTKDTAGTVAYDETADEEPCEYDTMGNLAYDGQNQLTTAYDFLNLPEKIAPTEQHSQAAEQFLVKYHYLWNGDKVAATDARQNGYMYIGSARYNLTAAKPALESICFGMGRIVRNANGYAPLYFLTDHLGSVRSVANRDGTVTAEYDYMPYGMQHKNGSLATSDDNSFRYNGKELQDRFFVDLYDSQARMQGMNGRFNSIDALAEKYRPISPYAYCGNNPIRFTDPDGRDWRDKVAGVIIGVATNISGTTSLRADYEPNDVDDYNNALAATDVSTAIIGAAMSEGGENAAITGTGIYATAATATLLTAGASVEVTGPTMAAGKGIALTGAATSLGGKILMLNAAKNAQSGYSYGKNSNNVVNPKKEAREQGRIKRAGQKAPEKYVKYKAKKLEQAKGKPARREAHDAKDKMGKDRTKTEIDEDYNY